MNILVKQIPYEKPLDVRFDMSHEDMIEGAPDNHFVKDVFEGIQCEGQLTRMQDDLFLSAQIKEGQFKTSCARCTDHAVHDLKMDMQILCMAYDGNEDSNDATSLYYFDGIELNLKKICREHLVLNLPMKVLCRDACLGLCVGCGVNLNEHLDHVCSSKPSSSMKRAFLSAQSKKQNEASDE